MSLQPYLRGNKWWAKGRVEYQGRTITPYIQRSTGAPTEEAAKQWCFDEEERLIREFLVGPLELSKQPITFGEAVACYDFNDKTAAYLLPIVDKIENTLIKDLTGTMIRDLARELYPHAGTNTWMRQVITPIRAVINRAHDEFGAVRAPLVQIKGFSKIEKTRQDKARGTTGRKRYPPGSWEWMLQFQEKASDRVAALALTMFVTGARIDQSVRIHPVKHFRPHDNQICIPGAKGFEDRWIEIPDWLTQRLSKLTKFFPRGWERTDDNMRLFGYADRTAPRKAWEAGIKAAEIEFLPFHSAGRHGFGQEMIVRNPIDEKAAGAFGGWADTNLMRRAYTHAEQAAQKVHQAHEAGLSRAEAKTKILIERTRK